MPPRLHDRSSTELIADAEALAPVYAPGWTSFKEADDPGHALIVLTARLVELLAERVNRVPEKSLLAFLDLVGIERPPGLPAEVPVTFLLSHPAEGGRQIPAGTQVATTQSETADAQVFETRNAFFATAARLVHALGVLPAHDLYGSLPALPLPPTLEDLADPSPEIGPFNPAGPGLLPVPHELYLASAALFARPEPADVRLDFTVPNGAVAVFAAPHLRWQRFDTKLEDWEDIPNVSSVAAGTAASVLFPAFAGTGRSTVAGQEDAWIVARLETAPEDLPALPSLSLVVGSVSTAQAPATAPDAALFNDTPLDLSKPAFPFGDRPRYGDAFHLASAKAFGPGVASVTLQITLRGYTLEELQAIFDSKAATITTKVEWQYLAAGGTWKTIAGGSVTHILNVAPTQTSLGAFAQLSSLQPQTAATQAQKDEALFGTLGGSVVASISFAPPVDAAPGKVGGIESRWVRAVLRSQAPYGRDGTVTITGGTATAVKPTFVPPVVEKVEIAYQHDTSVVALDRITTKNSFEHDQAPTPLFGAGTSLVPFVPLREYAPGAGSAGAAAPGFLADSPGLYLAFDRPFENAFVSLLVALVEPRDSAKLMPETGGPRVVWEYLAGGPDWKPLDVFDGTSDLTSTGVVGFLAPPNSAAATLWPLLTEERPLHWYRARLQAGAYTAAPRLRAVLPNTVMADNQTTVRDGRGQPVEWLLASGSGERGQRATIARRPVLAGEVWVRENEVPSGPELAELLGELGERLIEEGGGRPPVSSDVFEERQAGTPERQVWVRWLRVANFRSSGQRSRHYTLEAPSGVVTFGDGEAGLVPPVGKDNIVVRGLRSGGGEDANRTALPLAVKELKTSLPFVASVFNLVGASGGTGSWAFDQTLSLGPQLVKTRGRAVTVEDYEWLTLAAFGQVARAKAIATRKPGPGGALVFEPGAVSVIVVPKGAERTPQPTRGLLRRIEVYLRGRALGAIAAEIFALPPGYEEVSIATTVRPLVPAEASVVQRRVVRALEEFLHPLRGGEHGEGWPFGRSVHLSEVFAVIERTEGIDHVVSAAFLGGPPLGPLTVGENVLVASGAHEITVV